MHQYFCVHEIGSVLQGVLQEALSTKRFGPAQERFPHLEALNGIQSAVCFLWAAALLMIFPSKQGLKIAPISAYLRPAISNSIGPACGILALRNISYPAQVCEAQLAPHTDHPSVGDGNQPVDWGNGRIPPTCSDH